MSRFYRLSPRTAALTGLGLIVVTAAILLAMGRVPICTCGTIKLWTGEVLSSDNSQHIADWYTPSHIIHGILFYALLWLAVRDWSIGTRALMAIVIEAAWEILENTPFIIQRYREATMALGYTGDSVLNSVFDIGFMLLGFFFAARVPVALSVALVLFFEAFTAWMIRDNLILNVLMLLHPIDAIRTWQGG